MENLAQETIVEKPQSFRGLVGQLVENSKLLPPIIIGKNEELTVLDAVESDRVDLYVSGLATSDKRLSAVHCLTVINNRPVA